MSLSLLCITVDMSRLLLVMSSEFPVFSFLTNDFEGRTFSVGMMIWTHSACVDCEIWAI